MKIARGRADARWLPSRFNFALFRLIAFVRMSLIGPEQRDVTLILDRNQNNLESYLIGAWAVLTVTCWIAGTLFASWPVALALVVAFPVAITALEIPIIVVGLLRKWKNNLGLNSVVIMSLLIAAALYFARAHTWIRFAAWQFLGAVALNALAAPIAFLLRGGFERLENGVGGISSEL